MKSYTVVAIAHDGELVCGNCLNSRAELSVFHDWPDAQQHMDTDGYLSAVFAGDIDEDEICGRCNGRLI